MLQYGVKQIQYNIRRIKPYKSDTKVEYFISKNMSDLYGLIQPILCLIFVGPYCNITVPLVKHCVITKGPLYGVSYLYAVWLVGMNLCPTLYS